MKNCTPIPTNTNHFWRTLACCAGFALALTGCGELETAAVEANSTNTLAASASFLLSDLSIEPPSVAYASYPASCDGIYEGSEYSGKRTRTFPKGVRGINSCKDVRSAIEAENAWSYGDEVCANHVDSGWTAIHGSEKMSNCRLEGNRFVAEVSACCEDQLPMCPPGNRDQTSLSDPLSDSCQEAEDRLEDNLNGPYSSICGGAEVPGGVDVVKYECTPPGDIGNFYFDAHIVYMHACCDMRWPEDKPGKTPG